MKESPFDVSLNTIWLNQIHDKRHVLLSIQNIRCLAIIYI